MLGSPIVENPRMGLKIEVFIASFQADTRRLSVYHLSGWFSVLQGRDGEDLRGFCQEGLGSRIFGLWFQGLGPRKV